MWYWGVLIQFVKKIPVFIKIVQQLWMPYMNYTVYVPPCILSVALKMSITMKMLDAKIIDKN
jgi:hypothetical protein